MSFLRMYSSFIVKHPLVMVGIVLMLTILTALLSFVPILGAPPIPDFSEPAKGFEPRGTTISDRAISWQHLLDEFDLSKKSPQEYTFNPAYINKTTGKVTKPKTRRSALELADNACYMSLSLKWPSMVTVFATQNEGGNLLSAAKLKAMCAIEENYIRNNPRFGIYCQQDSKGGCCPSQSLGEYVAYLNNRTECKDITDDDVERGLEVVKNCSGYYFKGQLTSECPYQCKGVPQHCERMFPIYQYLTDKNFLAPNGDPKVLKYSTVFSPIQFNSVNLDFYYSVYEASYKHLDTLDYTNDVKIVAFKFGSLKFNKFNKQLLSDSLFIGIALVFVLMIIAMYTNCNAFYSLVVVFNVIFAFLIGYFLYHVIFRLTFFPFLNVVSFIFLVGISADDLFVYYDVWCEAKGLYPHGSLSDWTHHTLKHAGLSMFVTSFTTATAFFATATSHITALRLFGIFTGLSIICLYLLMVTWFPVIVVIYESYLEGCKCGKTRHRNTQSTQHDESLDRQVIHNPPDPPPAYDSEQNSPKSNFKEATSNNPEDLQTASSSKEQGAEMTPVRFGSGASLNHGNSVSCFLRNALHRLKKMVFTTWIPNIVTKMPTAIGCVFAFFALAVGFMVAVFYKPGLSLPVSKDFQVFSSSHPLEQFDLKYKDKFRNEDELNRGMWGYMVWGVVEEENGNHLDADDRGNLQWDNSMDMLAPESQSWLMELCKKLPKQAFYLPGQSCFMEKFVSEMSAISCDNFTNPCCGNSTFPYSREVFNYCLRKVTIGSSYNGPVYDIKTGEIKALHLAVPTKYTFTQEYEPMNSFWKDVNGWAEKEIEGAPDGLKNGWFISFVQFYNLQSSLSSGTLLSMGVSIALAFVVMFITTLNIFITIYSILTISFIIAVTVGSLVLLGWQLNILESITMSVAVGLSVDFTVHYGVAYCISPEKEQQDSRVRFALDHIGSAVSMAAVTTFFTGVLMTPSTILAYSQMGIFLMLVMLISWFFATFFFLPLCSVIGPKNNTGQLSLAACTGRSVSPSPTRMDTLTKDDFDETYKSPCTETPDAVTESFPECSEVTQNKSNGSTVEDKDHTPEYEMSPL